MSSTATIVICDRCDQRVLGSVQVTTVERAIAKGWEVEPRGQAFCPECRKLRARERVLRAHGALRPVSYRVIHLRQRQ